MNTAAMRADTATLLGIWGETLSVYRNTPTWSGGVGTDSWGLVGTISGDNQEVSGNTMIAEAGLRVKTVSEIHIAYDADVLKGDKIDFGGSKWRLVVGIAKYADRQIARLSKTEGAA